jgi:hypothetical protein
MAHVGGSERLHGTKEVRCAGPGCVAFFALAITILVQSEVLIARCRVQNHSDSPGCGVADAGRVACRTRLTRRQLQGTPVDQPGDPRSRPADRFLVLGNTRDGPHIGHSPLTATVTPRTPTPCLRSYIQSNFLTICTILQHGGHSCVVVPGRNMVVVPLPKRLKVSAHMVDLEVGPFPLNALVG